MILISTKTNNKIVRTDERVVCKIVFSITFNVSFWCSKEPFHREDSFVYQKCLSENIIVDLRIISKLIKDVLLMSLRLDIKHSANHRNLFF